MDESLFFYAKIFDAKCHMAPRVTTIVMYPRPQPDTICAYFLLKQFGEEQHPGISEAKLEFWNQVRPEKTPAEWEQAGYLLIDLGGGKFDHHRDDHATKSETAATLVAKHLGVSTDPALRKLLTYVKRDDLEGRGIVSKDILDRAFGLSAIIMNLNRDYPAHPDFVVDTVYRIFLAHFHEEYRRKVLIPKEWQELQQQGRAIRLNVATPARPLHVVLVESDSKTLVGFLRAVKSVQADLVVQRQSTGHTNIVTNQNKGIRLDLRPVAEVVRRLEAKRKSLDISGFNHDQLQKPGRLEGLEEWFYDNAANTLQNGGAAAEGITPTRITLPEMQRI